MACRSGLDRFGDRERFGGGVDNEWYDWSPCITLTLLLLTFGPASWSSGQSLPNNHEVPGSISDSTVGIFPEGEDSRGYHGLGRLVEFRFKGPPGTTSSCITTHIIGTT